jgi:putative metalloprotease
MPDNFWEKKMFTRNLLLLLLAALAVSGCAADGGFNKEAAVGLGGGVLQATTLDENSVKQTASLAAKEMDQQNKVAPDSSPYVIRLRNLTKGLSNYGGLNLNFKVYLSEQVNAFAMADGTVRVFSGLLDAMPDEQVLAVLCHEVGHVQLKHSYSQMKEIILTDVAFKAAVSVGGKIGALTSSQLGQLGRKAVTAHFSQSDELEADGFAVRALRDLGHDPYAMQRAIETLRAKFGSGGGFLSSHPANDKRIAHIKEAIEQL